MVSSAPRSETSADSARRGFSMTVNSPQGVPPAPPKKGMSPLAWVGIGCVVILIIGFVAFAGLGFLAKRKFDQFSKNPGKTAAEFIVKANPDLELVSSDDQTITVKDKKTGEVATMNFADIKNGKFKFSSNKGSATFDPTAKDGGMLKVTDEKGNESTFTGGAGAPKNLPSWIPTYPSGTTQGSFDASTAEGHTGAFVVTTQDSVDQVINFYEAQLKAAVLTVEKNSLSTNGKESGGS